MNVIGIDMGKYKSYVVVETNGKVVREGYVETTREGITDSTLGVKDPVIVLESSCLLDNAVAMLDGYNIVAAHPSRVNVITSSMKKTDKNDAHTLIDLYKAGYLPTSYVPPPHIREARDLARARLYLGRRRTSIKNKIRDLAFRKGVMFKGFRRETIEELSGVSPLVKVFIGDLKGISAEMKEIEKQITEMVKSDKYAKLLQTIPGIGNYSGLGLSAEIGDVSRFADEDRICAYAGLVPRVFQTGTKEWKGHLRKDCDKFMKYLLIECVAIHVNRCSRCFICREYYLTRTRKGSKTARVSAARKLLKVIYYMLKLDQDFDSYLRERGMRQWNTAAPRPSLDCAPSPSK